MASPVVSIRLDPDLLRRVDRAVAAYTLAGERIDRTTVVSEALVAWLAQHEDKAIAAAKKALDS